MNSKKSAPSKVAAAFKAERANPRAKLAAFPFDGPPNQVTGSSELPQDDDAGGGGSNRRNIPKDHPFDSRALKPMAKALWAASVSLGHALTSYRHMSRLKSSTISPDGMLGGRGYVMQVSDMRKRLYDACESLSAITDTLHDEINAPHWQPRLAELDENEAGDIERYVEESQEILEDPEHDAESEAKEIEEENDDVAKDEGDETFFDDDEEAEEEPQFEDAEEEDAEEDAPEEEEPFAEESEDAPELEEDETEESPEPEDSEVEETDDLEADEPVTEDSEEEPFEEDEESAEEPPVDDEEPTDESVDEVSADPEDEDPETDSDAPKGKEFDFGVDDVGDEEVPEDEEVFEEDESTPQDEYREIPEGLKKPEKFDGDSEEAASDPLDAEDPQSDQEDEEGEDETLEDIEDEEEQTAAQLPDLKPLKKKLKKTVKQASNLDTYDYSRPTGGPRVEERALEETYDINPPEAFPSDEWGTPSQRGYDYTTPWENDLRVEAEAMVPDSSSDATPTDAWDFGLGYGAKGDGAGGYENGSGEGDGSKGVWGPQSGIPGTPAGSSGDTSAPLDHINERLAEGKLPNDGDAPVARSDYYRGDKGNLVNSQTGLPSEPVVPGQASPGLLNTNEVYEDAETPYIRYDYTTHTYRDDPLHDWVDNK